MRLVIKIGTSTLAHKTGNLNIRHIEHLCKVISDLKNAGHEIILVSSGAIGMGVGKLGLKGKPAEIEMKQAAASIGQCELMYTYDKLFSEYNHIIGQILITSPDIEDETRKKNFTNTLFKLLELGVIPIINENDSISTDEIVIGDNDTLSAFVAVSVEADLLVLLSDIEGLYTSDPRTDKTAKIIPVVDEIDEKIESLCGGKGSELGTGGMITKIHAAKIATSAGVDMIITNGENPESLYDIVEGKNVGTLFRKVK